MGCMFSKPYLWVPHCFSLCILWHRDDKGKIHPAMIQGSRETTKKKVLANRERDIWTERTKNTERLKQTGRHKKETNDRDSEIQRERERRWDKHIDQQRDRLLVYPPPPQLPVTHSRWQPPSCLCLCHLNHTRTWYCHHSLSAISN